GDGDVFVLVSRQRRSKSHHVGRYGGNRAAHLLGAASDLRVEPRAERVHEEPNVPIGEPDAAHIYVPLIAMEQSVDGLVTPQGDTGSTREICGGAIGQEPEDNVAID